REGRVMSTATATAARRGLLRHSPWDALLVALALGQGALLLAGAFLAAVAVGLWWGSNPVAHNFVHRPFFRWRWLNSLFGLYLSAVLGVPQTAWRDLHLAHHAGATRRPKPGRQMAAEFLVVLAVWAWLAAF